MSSKKRPPKSEPPPSSRPRAKPARGPEEPAGGAKPERHAGLRPRIGRPSKLTPELAAKICDNLLIGMPVEWACAAEGISKTTFYAWKTLGEKERPDGIHRAFLNAVERATAEAMRDALAIVREGKRHWQAHAWTLERRWPELFGRRERVEMSGPVDGLGGPVRLQIYMPREDPE